MADLCGVAKSRSVGFARNLALIFNVSVLVFSLFSDARGQEKELIYSNTLTSADSVADWVMEGPGDMELDSSGLVMCSPGEEGHHVLWCPREFPERFVAEWEVRNLHPEAGLCIVFFAAKGRGDESVLAEELATQTGIFKQYTKGDIDNYHISYYANTPTQQDRPHSHLRKNRGFRKVQEGEIGIAADSEAVHHVRLVKDRGHIRMEVDGRMILDWTDDGERYGKVLGSGWIGFRQMKWTKMMYRNFRVWELK
ncbi:MAG: hypothetical protein RL266_1465 [Bacteroidota bacterium]